MTTLDSLRAAYPNLSFCLYAFAGEPVKLEIINQDGDIFRSEGETEEAAILVRFPELAPEPPAPPAPPAASIFD